jgi:hypothetical protein
VDCGEYREAARAGAERLGLKRRRQQCQIKLGGFGSLSSGISVAGGAGGAILTAIVGAIKNKVAA